MTATFHRLRVAALEPVADDAVALTFDVPDDLSALFRAEPGQHVAVRVPGDAVRRSYSVCSAPGAPLRIGVRKLPGGRFSGAVLDGLRPDDELEVLTPTGRFGAALPGLRRPAFVAGGSGITPVLAMVAAALGDPAVERVVLLDVNRAQGSVMFLDEVAGLKDRWPERLQVVHVLTGEAQESPLLTGRVDDERLDRIRRTLLGGEEDGWFVCGPFGLVTGVRNALVASGVPAEQVHTELFHAETPLPVAVDLPSAGTRVEVTLGGLRSRFELEPGEVVLDGLLRLRADAPYACQGGVCGTCRARLVEGEVVMDATWALEPDEVARGDVLTCQARARSGHLVLDFEG